MTTGNGLARRSLSGSGGSDPGMDDRQPLLDVGGDNVSHTSSSGGTTGEQQDKDIPEEITVRPPVMFKDPSLKKLE